MWQWKDTNMKQQNYVDAGGSFLLSPLGPPIKLLNTPKTLEVEFGNGVIVASVTGFIGGAVVGVAVG